MIARAAPSGRGTEPVVSADLQPLGLGPLEHGGHGFHSCARQRTSLRRVDDLSDQYLEAVAKFGSRINQAPTQLSFLQAKLQAYLACSKTKATLKRANAEIEQCLSETDPGKSEESGVFALISHISVLRSVIFLNTYRQLLKARGDLIRAEKVRAEAALRANRAGLAHQLAWIRAGSPFTARRRQNAYQMGNKAR